MGGDQKQAILLVVIFAIVIAMLVIRRLIRGVNPRRSQSRLISGSWIGPLIFIACSIFLWFNGKLNDPQTGKPLDLAPEAFSLVVAVGLTVVIIVACVIYLLIKRDAVIFRAYRLANDGRPEEALEMLRHKMATRPKAVRAAAMGWILNRADRHAEAAEAFAVAEEMEPKTVMYSVERAVAMSKIGQGEAALAHVARLRQQHPTEGGYALAAAAVLDEMERAAEAREEFRRAEDLLAKYPKAFHAQHTISFLRSRLAQRVGRDGATGLKAELERAFAQRTSGPATIARDAADDPETDRRGTG
jgi:tetratricopeptide (TPR) repeat protein